MAHTVTLHRNETALIENGRTRTCEAPSNLVTRISNNPSKGIHSVGIVMSHRTELIAYMQAVLKRGAWYIPAESGFPASKIRCMMAEARVDLILAAVKSAVWKHLRQSGRRSSSPITPPTSSI